jgi:outer membrane receptor for ferrienterochelin and colicin
MTTSLSLLSIFVLIALCSSVVAQGVSYGTIEGLVTDDKGNPIAGAAVTATGPQGVKTAVTGDRGKFVFKDLVPGDYQVKAEAQNYATVLQTDVKIVVGHSTQVPFALAAGVTEQVTVTSEAPIVDMKATSVGATVSVDEFVEYIPLGRNFTAMLQLAPGVVSSGPYAENNGNFSMSGSSGLENSYLIDGVNITNSGYGGIGSFNRVYGSLSTGVTNDFIDQVEIKSGGFEAEFGQATGGVVNAIVKSGTNSLAGQVSVYGSPDSLEATRKERVRNPDAIAIESTSRQDIGFNIGGPLIKDKLFWFVAYNPVATETTWKRNVENLDTLCIDNDCTDSDGDGQPDNGYRDPNQTDTGRTETRERENDNYAGKVSWFLHPNHRIEGTAFGDP